MSENKSPDSDPSSPKASVERRINPWTVPALMIVIALGAVVGVNYIFTFAVKGKAAPEGRLPFLSRLDEDMEVTSHTGQPVKLGLGPGVLAQDRMLYMKHGDDLADGRITLVSYLFTRCPSGCAGIQGIMAEVLEKFSEEPNLHLLSVSLDPDHDTPQVLDAFRKKFDFEAPNWWFLTGDRKKLRAFMTTKVGFNQPRSKPEAEQLFPGDLFAHDMRIALIDHTGHVRGFYEIMHPEMSEVFVKKLHKDTASLLAERRSLISAK